MTLPNALSITRIPLAIVIAVLASRHSWGWAFTILLIAGLTDVLDGYIAKSFDMMSKSGETFDMVGDLAMTIGALIGLLVAHRVSWTLVVVMALVLVAVQVVNSFMTDSKLFTHFGKWFMPCYFLLVLWLVILKYAELALDSASFAIFAVTLALVSVFLVWLKRHRFAEWFNGKPLPA